VTQSPIEQLLGAIDKLDVEASIALMAPDCRLLIVDGRRAEGTAAARELFNDFVAAVRSASHTITAQWHQDDVWIAEVEATYELRDRLKIDALPRACVLREGPDGIADLHIYGADERPLGDPTVEEPMRLGGRWIPSL
jgi:SnoaL-like domain